MEVPEDCSIVPRPGTCVCPPGAFSGLAQGRKVFHCSSVCESAEKQHSLPSETQGNDCPSHTGLSQAHQHLSTLTARKRGCLETLPKSRMTRGRVDAWGCARECCFVQAAFWIPGSKYGSGTYGKLWVDIKLATEFEIGLY